MLILCKFCADCSVLAEHKNVANFLFIYLFSSSKLPLFSILLTPRFKIISLREVDNISRLTIRSLLYVAQVQKENKIIYKYRFRETSENKDGSEDSGVDDTSEIYRINGECFFQE